MHIETGEDVAGTPFQSQKIARKPWGKLRKQRFQGFQPIFRYQSNLVAAVLYYVQHQYFFVTETWTYTRWIIDTRKMQYVLSDACVRGKAGDPRISF
jgi:hypothetical protein